MTDAQRKARIKYRAGLYAQGVLTMEEFADLEREDTAIEDAKKDAVLNAMLPEDLRDAVEDSSLPETTATAPAPQLKEDGSVSLVGLTKEAFNELTLEEQNRLYKIAPERIERLIHDKPAYMSLLDPQPKDYSKTTAEEFKSMRLQELQELYNADPKLYNDLLEESKAK